MERDQQKHVYTSKSQNPKLTNDYQKREIKGEEVAQSQVRLAK